MKWFGRRRSAETPEVNSSEVPEAPSGIYIEMHDGSTVELEPTYKGLEKGDHVWQVKVPEGFSAMRCDKIPPHTGIEWHIPGISPWRHP
jgi:hypothetical protein